MQTTVQLGKNGVTDGFLEMLKNAFKTHEIVKITLLKAATRNRTEVEEIAQQICTVFGKKYTYTIVGFTIFIKKWRKTPFSKTKIRK